MQYTGVPMWVWVFVLVVMAPAVASVAISVAWELFAPKPAKKVRVGDTELQLWIKERKFSSSADAIIVPVGPDLKMVAGIAKWVRDATGDRIQHEADEVAPLPPGEAFAGAGGKYRFKIAALAVVMDDAKRTSPEWIARGTANAMTLAAGRDARSVLVPDMTEDLLRQPTTITDQQRQETCAPIARAMMEGILAGSEGYETVKIWVWRTVNQDIFIRELERLEQDQTTGARLERLVDGSLA